MKGVILLPTVISSHLTSARFDTPCVSCLPVQKAYWAIEILGLLSINQCNWRLVQRPRSHPTPDIFFLFLLLYLQFMSSHDDLAVPCGNEHVTQRRHAVPTTKSRFPISCVFATLKMAGNSNYSIEDCLVSSVSVHERERTVKTMCQIVTVFRHRFGNPFPRRAALFSWEKRAFLYWNVNSSPWNGRLISRMMTCAAWCRWWDFVLLVRLVPLVPLPVKSVHTIP